MSRATPKDLGLALVAAVVVSEGPFTPSALAPSLVAGAMAAALVLYYRLSWIPRVAPKQQAAGRSRYKVARSAWVCLAGFATLSAPTVSWMYSEWTGSVSTLR